jgi:small nuclear ribonucleoprotein (snRNP)-like protein
MAAAPEYDARLDIYSAEFSPREALLSARLSVPYPNVTPLNNLTECRRYLPPDAADALPMSALTARAPILPVHAAAPAAEPSGDDTRPASRGERVRAQSKQRRTAQDKFERGPLKLIKELIRRRVCVVTRHRNCVRGTCTGVLMAADRHLNLLLVDAEDVYVTAREAERCLSECDEQVAASALIARAVRSSGAAASTPTAQPRAPQRVRRSYGQLFLRGEGVVLVYAAI